MLILTQPPAVVNAASSVETWPTWSDRGRWEPGPDDSGEHDEPGQDDRDWWAGENETWDDEEAGPTDADFDAMAAEAEASDKVCSGYCPW